MKNIYYFLTFLLTNRTKETSKEIITEIDNLWEALSAGVDLKLEIGGCVCAGEWERVTRVLWGRGGRC